MSATRVLIVSDTHGELDARVLELARGCAVVVHGGDVGAAAVLQALAGVAKNVHAVHGNNDVARKWPAGEEATLEALPAHIRVPLPGGTLAVVHGDRHGSGATRLRRLRKQFGDARLIVFGHSHHLALDLDETPWVVNPGAAGRVRTFGGPSCVVLEAHEHDDWLVRAHRFAP